MTGCRPTPAHAASEVKRLAANARTFRMYRSATDDTLGFGLDVEEVREILQRIDSFDFLKTEQTQKYYPGTWSDYYTAWIDECGTRMFIKLLVHKDVLWVTSFKKDDRYEW